MSEKRAHGWLSVSFIRGEHAQQHKIPLLAHCMMVSHLFSNSENKQKKKEKTGKEDEKEGKVSTKETLLTSVPKMLIPKKKNT